MRLDATQQLRLEQTMKLSPRIIQAMEILQLPTIALLERIDAELQSNPVLEMRETPVDVEHAPPEDTYAEDRGEHDMVVSDENGHSEDFERLADFTDEYGQEFVTSDTPPPSKPRYDGERDRKLDAMANTPAPGQTLQEYLLEQWAFLDAGPLDEAGRLLIENMEDDGYIRVPLEDIASASVDGADESVSVAELKEALRLVQTLDPPGVGARNLQECLLIQLDSEAATGKDVSLERTLVVNFLRDIEMNRLPQIARRANREIDDIKAALANLSHLNPRPGLLIGTRDVPVITPDVQVDLDEDGHVVVTMPDERTPQLYISRTYRRLSRDRRAAKDARQFLQRNIRSAEWLIGAIQQRRHTVRRVCEEVFEVQRDFLLHGREALRPLPMADVAQKVGVHVATVSRAVAGKYVQTPRGIFPLRMFFSGGTTTASGEDVSWDAVKIKLKEVIDNEDKANPLNDDQLAEALNDAGIDIARRTVAKYRKLMDIPPARRRKQY